ncbi:MAG: FkbM family methyltransferase [Chloroflexota bacterium]|nr:FkbM family methyltransferase [Chloroflexota bacterium]
MIKKTLLKIAASTANILPDVVKRSFYRIKPLARLIRAMLNRTAPTGFTQVAVAAGELAGARLRLDLQLEKDYWLGTYETELQTAISELVEPGWVAYDVGANIGYMTLMLARSVGKKGKIFAFEALPDNVKRLRTNIALNPALESNITITSGAVTNSSHPVRFLIGPSGAMGKAEGSAGRQVDYNDAIEIPGIVLDDFIYQQGNPAPDVIKMDIEGGEVLALQGMSRILTAARPLIFLELHGHEAAQVAWDTLTAAGYQICRMQRGYPPVPSLETLDWKAYLVAFPPKD